MSKRKPFTMRARRSIPQHRFGDRPRNEWGAGDLPAPFAAGDVLWLPPETRMGVFDGRLKDEPPGQHFLVDTAFSVDEGDGWYFRVTAENNPTRSSDRLHVFHYGRSSFDKHVDYMAPFEMVDCADPEGLAIRGRMLADGWTWNPQPCRACGAAPEHQTR